MAHDDGPQEIGLVGRGAVGPGKYDEACTAARLSTGAQAVVLIVLEGRLGSAFSVQAVGPDISALLPQLLCEIAADILAALPKEKSQH